MSNPNEVFAANDPQSVQTRATEQVPPVNTEANGYGYTPATSPAQPQQPAPAPSQPPALAPLARLSQFSSAQQQAQPAAPVAPSAAPTAQPAAPVVPTAPAVQSTAQIPPAPSYAPRPYLGTSEQPSQPSGYPAGTQHGGTRHSEAQHTDAQHAGTQHGAPGANTSSDPYATSAAQVPPTTAGTKTKTRRPWAPVVGAAAIAALLASGGTAAAVLALDNDKPTTTTSNLADVGKDTDTTNHTVPVASSTSTNPDWQAVTKAVSPSVVSIQMETQSGEAEGSGVILDKEGHVLTNNHVVSGASNDTVQVTLADGRLYNAKIVGLDATTDLAVVKLENPPTDLVAATLGDSDDVTVGESVMAVGNPLGLANTATTGIVSALDRPVSASGESGGTAVVTNAIQIDAAVNPGNSGGPLFNAQGEVIGITSSIATMSTSTTAQSGSIGLGFAIPVNLAKNISDQLIKNGTAEHAFLGVSLSDGEATADGVTRRGAKVEQVTDDAPAAKAGIKTGDVIVAIDGHTVGGAESLTAFVREESAGETAKLTLVRDGKAMDVTVTFATKQADTTTDQGSSQDQQGDGSQGQQGQGQQNDPTNPNNIPDPNEWFFGGQG